MRVITGSAGGRKLKTLESLDIRPTADRVKEAIFSAVQFELQGAVVLDLFAGCGQMGIEALSRGAKYAYFVDMARHSCDVTRENLLSTGLGANTRVATMDCIEFLTNTKYTFDIAILDPPYFGDLLQKVLPILEQKMNDGGKVICEHETGLALPDKIGKLFFKKHYKYGKVEVTLYAAGGEEE